MFSHRFDPIDPGHGDGRLIAEDGYQGDGSLYLSLAGKFVYISRDDVATLCASLGELLAETAATTSVLDLDGDFWVESTTKPGFFFMPGAFQSEETLARIDSMAGVTLDEIAHGYGIDSGETTVALTPADVQVGDRLLVVGNDPSNPAGPHHYKIGDLVTVEHDDDPHEGTVWVRGDGLGQWILASDLESVDETPEFVPAFAVGDRVVIADVPGTVAADMAIGKPATVTIVPEDADGVYHVQIAAEDAHHGSSYTQRIYESGLEAGPKFQTGDKVRVTRRGGVTTILHAHPVGSIVTIIADRDRDGDYDTRGADGSVQYVNEADLEALKECSLCQDAGYGPVCIFS